MLKPAICYKEEIEKALKEFFYTKDMFYYVGNNDSYLLTVFDNSENGRYQWAILSEDERLIGFIDYQIERYFSRVYNFGAFSFERGTFTMGKELHDLLEELVAKYHRVEFRAVSGNPAVKSYDKFLEKHKDIGKKHILKDAVKDTDGNYHDDYIYEFVNPKVG